MKTRVVLVLLLGALIGWLCSADYAEPKNMWEGTLDTDYVEGTDALISIGDTTGWPAHGVVYIDDGSEWILVRYDSLDAGNGDLETLSDADADFDSASGQGHTFSSGTAVILVQAADYNRQIVEDITGAVAAAVFFEASNEIGNDAGLTFDATDDRLDITRLAIDATQGDYGLKLINTTAALTGERIQISPPSIWEGRGWETDVGSSMAVAFRAFARPITGAAAPTGAWDLQASIDGGAYSGLLTVFSTGFVGIGRTTPTSALHVYAADGVADNTWAAEFRNLEGTVGRNYGILTQGGSDASDIALEVIDVASANLFRVTGVGNVGIGTPTFDGTAAGCLTLAAATAPAAHTDNQAYLWAEDVNAAAGYAGLHMMGENGASSIEQIVVGVVIKGDTGQTANPHEGLIEINTFDNTLKMYADGGWRDIAASW